MRGMLRVGAGFVLLSGFVWAEDVTLRVRDQFAAEIPGSRVVIAGVGTFPTGGTATLSPGSYMVDIYPGIAGLTQTGGLSRRENLIVTVGLTSRNFEWITTEVTIHLRDQHGAAIPASQVTIDWVPGLGYHATPYRITLPITDPLVYPTLGGPAAEGGNKGYDIQLVPGLLGIPIGATVLRRNPGTQPSPETVAVHAGTTEIDFRWITKDVTFALKDQHGVAIPGSKFQLMVLDSPGRVRDLPVTLTLPITDMTVYPDMVGSESEAPAGGYGYGINLVPGILGEYAGGHLQREEGTTSGHEVRFHDDTQTLDYEWITTTLTMNLLDQSDVPILGSEIFVYAAPASGYHPTPFTATLPISDRTVYPTMSLVGAAEGPGQHGYDLLLVPGVVGQTQRVLAGPALLLYRTAGTEHPLDESVQVHANQTQLNLHWTTTRLTVDLRDQYGATIPGSRVLMANMPSTGYQAVPFQMTLPISDRTVYPTMDGGASEGPSRGYDIFLYPGIDGRPQVPAYGNLLFRYPGTQTNPTSDEVRVHAGQTSLFFEWTTVSCPVQVRNSLGTVLPGSSLGYPVPFLPHSPGTLVFFPITDNTVYPNIQGTYMNGYPITVTPQGLAPLSDTFEFEVGTTVAGAAVFTPASFSIGGQSYSLGCTTNRPPVGDAGPNVLIYSSQQATTVIQGTASDPDGGPLSYRWLEGAIALTGSLPVGPGGAAPLNLAAVPLFAFGPHVLLLEVSDGSLLTTSSMTLTVGNSPPTATCTGAGTYEAGVDTVMLGGTVADFDGDSLTWSWRLGTTVLASGVLPAPTGGGPASLPVVPVTTGYSGVLPLGTHILTLVVSDGFSPAIACPASVVVRDTRAPSLAPTVNLGILWPPNHKMVDIVITTNARDPSNGPVTLTATVSSSEDPDKDGDGHTIPDWSEPVIEPLSGLIRLQLRAERAGMGPGRTYSIVVKAVDLSGNTSTATVVCIAPHDLRR